MDEISEEYITDAEVKWGSNPEKPELSFCLATILVKSSQTNRVKKAIQLFQDLLEKEKYVSESYFYTSLGYFGLGDIIEARIWASRLLRIHREHPEGIILRAKIDAAIAQHRKLRLEGLNLVSSGSQSSPSSPSANLRSSTIVSNMVQEHRQRSRTINSQPLPPLATPPPTKDQLQKFVLEDLLKRFSSEELLHLVKCFHNMDTNNNMNKNNTSSNPIIYNNLIDRLQFGSCMGQMGLCFDQNEIFYRLLFNAFYGCSKRLTSQSDDAADFSRHLRPRTPFINYWQKSSTAMVECIDLDTFLAGMSILCHGDLNERALFAFDMLDSSRQGYISESQVYKYIESSYRVLMELNGDPPSAPIKHISRQLFKFMDVHDARKVTPSLYLKAIKRDIYYMTCLKEKPTPSLIPRFTMPTCLRRGTMCSFASKTWSTCLDIMIGMRTVIDMTKPLTRPVRREDFAVELRIMLPRPTHFHQDDIAIVGGIDSANNNSADDQSHALFVDYAPHVFRKLRALKNISDTEYMRSISPEQLIGNLLAGQLTCFSEQLSENSGGRSGACFYYTHDGKFIIKQISSEEFSNYRKSLVDYYYHMEQHPDSIVSQFFGCFEYDDMGFMVMKNVFDTNMAVHEIYDLKGSKVSRSSPDGPVYKDNDLHGQTIRVGSKREQVINIMTRDVNFLQSNKFTDYSILLGIHFVDGYNKTNKRKMNSAGSSVASSSPTLTTHDEQHQLQHDEHDDSNSELDDDDGDGYSMFSFQEIIAELNTPINKNNISSNTTAAPISTAHRNVSSVAATTPTGARVNSLPTGEFDHDDDEEIEYHRRHRSSDIASCEKSIIDFYDAMHHKNNVVKKSMFDGGLVSSDGKEIYFLGIIDTLTEFTMKKTAELTLKTLKYPGRRAEISAQPPAEYAARLKKFMNDLVT
ncbi:Pip4k2b [Acrasis kona]|uniref:Pip4k2b n=1 Tax=Acrasis kona TaxID=1008807 RepID=A0AAW2ZKI5_9EUKA